MAKELEFSFSDLSNFRCTKISVLMTIIIKELYYILAEYCKSRRFKVGLIILVNVRISPKFHC